MLVYGDFLSFHILVTESTTPFSCILLSYGTQNVQSNLSMHFPAGCQIMKLWFLKDIFISHSLILMGKGGGWTCVLSVNFV